MLYCQCGGYKMKKTWRNRKKGRIGYSCGYRACFGHGFCSIYTISEFVLKALMIADSSGFEVLQKTLAISQ